MATRLQQPRAVRAINTAGGLASRLGLSPSLDEGAAVVDPLPWIAWSAGSSCHDWLTHVLRQEGVGTRISCTVGSYPTQLALVAGNVGAAAIPRLGRDSVPDGVRFVTTRPALNRTIYAINRTEDDDRGAIRACVDALVAAATRFQNLA
mgnify:CR=1 FL=1